MFYGRTLTKSKLQVIFKMFGRLLDINSNQPIKHGGSHGSQIGWWRKICFFPV